MNNASIIVCIVMTAIGLGVASIGLVLWIIGRIGQMKMLKTLGYAHPVHAWIPFTRQYSLGWMAEQLENGKKPKKHGRIYLLLTIVLSLISISLVSIAIVIMFMTVGAEGSIDHFDSVEAMETVLMPLIFVTLLMMFPVILLSYAVYIYGFVLNYMVYNIFNPEKATLYTVISVVGVMLFGVDVTDVLYFMLRKKTPHNLRVTSPEYERYKPSESGDDSDTQHTAQTTYGYNPNAQYGAQPPYGYNPNAQNGAQPPYGYNPNAQYGAQPPYGYNPNAQYGAQPPYGYNPNVQYGAQPPYGYNLNAQNGAQPPYGYNPNAQYGAQPPYGYNPNAQYGAQPGQTADEPVHAPTPAEAAQPENNAEGKSPDVTE